MSAEQVTTPVLGDLFLEALTATRAAEYECSRFTHSEVPDRTALDAARHREAETQSAFWKLLLDVAPQEYGK